MDEHRQSLPLRRLFAFVEREAILCAALRYQAGCWKSGEAYMEPSYRSTANLLRKKLAYEVSLIGADGTVIAVYRISLTTVREIVRRIPQREAPQKKLRPDTVVRLPRDLVDRARVNAEPGETVHQAVERILTTNLDQVDQASISILDRLKQPLRRLGLVG
jgi:hypothetical protein